MVEKRVEKLEKVVGEIGSQIAEIAADFKYMRERIHGYLETHDKVIRQEEQIKVANKRIADLEDAKDEQSKLITQIKVNYASISAVVSIAGTLLTSLILNAMK